MSIEDALLQFEGLDPKKVIAILDDLAHLLGVIKTEMPRIERLVANLKVQIEAYEAKQKQVNQQWRMP